MNHDTTFPDYLDHIEDLWDSVMHASSLRTFIGAAGPMVPLRLDEFTPPLTGLDVAEYAIEENDGHLPPSMRQLALQFVDFDDQWFGPELFDSLEILLLRNMQEPALETFILKLEVVSPTCRQSCGSLTLRQVFAALDRPAPLHTLSLHLYPAGFVFLQQQDFVLLERLLAAFKPSSFPNLHTLEILSTPGSDSFALSARTLASQVPKLFPRLKELKLCLGTGGTLLSLRYSMESLVSGGEGSERFGRADFCFRRHPSRRHLQLRLP